MNVPTQTGLVRILRCFFPMGRVTIGAQLNLDFCITKEIQCQTWASQLCRHAHEGGIPGCRFVKMNTHGCTNKEEGRQAEGNQPSMVYELQMEPRKRSPSKQSATSNWHRAGKPDASV